MKLKLRNILVVFITVQLIACGGGEPSFTQVVVKSNDRGVLLDTKDADTLDKIHEYFYDRTEANSADPDFFYLLDITTAEGTTRWQYSDEGFIRNFENSSSTIYELRSVEGFNSIARIK